MPLFQRPDGDPVTDESDVRRMMPYLMRGRNESAVYHEQNCDITKARAWLRIYNQKHEQAATLFHLMLFAIARGFHKRPGINRFVNGRRLYQRKHVELSFAAKKSMSDEAPLVTVKVRFGKDDSFTTILKRVVKAIEEGRGPTQSITDKQLVLAMSLPSPVLSLTMTLLRWLDRINLLPRAMIDSDPMFCTAFIANLGSVGLDNSYHHLYEYGNASLFAVIGAPKRQHVLDRRGNVEARDMIQIRWTFDERINDGMYAGLAMREVQKVVEDPSGQLGSPDADATHTAHADDGTVPAYPAITP
jgi:pyruvate/2-oxoglutarate dehydrogenase complex dihydrolipoamide acyltransferase (E2) component